MTLTLLSLLAAWFVVALVALTACRAAGCADKTEAREDARLAAWLSGRGGGARR